MAYDINYNDERFTEVEADKQEALSEAEQMYGDMINESDKFYQAQIDASKDWADKQAQLQQEQTDFAIEKIEQQKEQEHKDYIKEQSGAYVDWQKQSNPYGVNAEQIASMGLQNSGYAESSQVAMYTAYQNRVAAARESYKLAVLNYDNAIKEAILQNNSALAEIAYKSLQQQLELSLQSFQYQNSLLIEKANKKAEIDDRYYNRSQNVLAQMNHENALDFQREQFNWQKSKYSSGSGGSSSSGGSGKITGSSSGGIANAGLLGATLSASSSRELTVDMHSVNDLGYGPIDEVGLNELVASGEVVEYEENGKLKYMRRSDWNKMRTKQFFDSLK